MSPQNKDRLAGCPFTGFGPCAASKCIFFVPTLDTPASKACLITAGYYKALFNTIFLQQALFGTELPKPQADFLFPVFALRASESFASALAGLDALLKSPQTDPDLKVLLAETREALRRNLKEFLRN
jgi:hypothetical protein